MRERTLGNEQMKAKEPRGTRPDAETKDKIYIIKNVSELRATYQIRLLLFRAVKLQKKLILVIPESCLVFPDLTKLISENEKTVLIERR